MKRILLISIIMMLCSMNTFAQIPKIINYQGMILGTDEKPVPEKEYKLTFKIYDDGQNLIWTEVHNNVFIGGGRFHVILGSMNPLDLPFDQQYFLGIQVDNDPEIEPRMVLTSAAYSMNSDKVNGFEVSHEPAPNTLLPLGNDSKFPASVLPLTSSGNFLKKGVPDTSRGETTTPMLLISNLGAGAGINGRSQSGEGVGGRSESDHGIVGWTGNNESSGVYGHTSTGFGVSGRSTNKHGVYGVTSTANITMAGVYGHANEAIGVKGHSFSQHGVYGQTETGEQGLISGVYGISENGTGVTGISTNYNGIKAITSSNVHAALAAGNEGAGAAIYAHSGTNNIAAIFDGNVQIRRRTNQAVLIEFGEGLDYAEGFNVSENRTIKPGTVLAIDAAAPGKLKICTNAYDTKVAGIAAGANGLGSAVKIGVDQFDCDVALAGRVYCNVDATYGEVSPGDLLTTSATPGFAMLVTDHLKAQGAIIGKAMEALAKGEKGQILVLVTLQ